MRVVVISGIRLYREGLVLLLRDSGPVAAHERGVEVAGTDDGTRATALVTATRPAIAIVDAGLVVTPGLVASMRAVHPPLRVVAFGVRDVAAEVVACAESGSAGYVPSDAGVAELVDVLAAVERDEVWCSPSVSGALLRRVGELSTAVGLPPRPVTPGRGCDALTGRELEVVALIEQGLMNKQIARRLGISLSTVKNHVHRILQKQAVASREQVSRRDSWTSGADVRT